MKIKKLAKGIILLTITTLMTGCWDSMEINNRSIILEFAVDKNDEYVYDPTKLLDDQGIYDFYYTIPDFGKLSGTQSLATDMEALVKVKAPTLASSIDDLQVRTKNTISFSHVKSVLIGEELMKAPQLFEQMIDSISRDMVITRNTPILAVNGDAGLTTQVENSEQPIVGLYIMEFFNNKERASNFFNKQLLGNFIKDMEETGVSTLPIFHVEHLEEKKSEEEANKEEADKKEEVDQKGKSDSANPMSQGEKEKGIKGDAKDQKVGDTSLINISGGAVIKDYELIDYITKEEVRSQLFVQGKIKNSPVVVIYNEVPLTYNVKQQKSKLKLQEIGGQIQCLVEIDVKGNVSEYLAQRDSTLVDKEATKEIEKLIAGEIISQINIGIEKSKEMNVDFMGFGLECYRKEPELWKKHGESWAESGYKNMPIAIGVNVDIQSTGIQE